MANYITKELRLSIEASLKNANSTIGEIKKLMSHYTFDGKSNAKFTEAQKTLEKITKDMQLLQTQSFISDKDLTKLNKMSSTINQTTTSVKDLYKNLQTKGIEQFSKTYIAEMQKIAKQTEQIKQDYFKKTGKNYDKEIAQIDTLTNKIKQYRAEKEKIQSAEYKQSLMQKELEGPTKRLAEEIQMREKLLELQQRAKQKEQEIYSSAAKDYGFNNFSEMEKYSKLLKSELPSSIQLTGVQEQMLMLKEIEAKMKVINETAETKEQKEANILELLQQQNIINQDTSYEKALAVLSERIAQNKKETLQLERAITAERRKQREISTAVKTTKTNVQNAVGAIYSSSGIPVSSNTIDKQLQTATLNIKGLEAETSDDNLQQVITNVGNMIRQELEDIENKLSGASEELENLEDVSNQLTQLENLSTDMDLRRETEKSAKKIDTQTKDLQESEKKQTQEINEFTSQQVGSNIIGAPNVTEEVFGSSLVKSFQDALFTDQLDLRVAPEQATQYNEAIQRALSMYRNALANPPGDTMEIQYLQDQLGDALLEAYQAYQAYGEEIVRLGWNTEETIEKANRIMYKNLTQIAYPEALRGLRKKKDFDAAKEYEQGTKPYEPGPQNEPEPPFRGSPPKNPPPPSSSTPTINFDSLSAEAQKLEKDVESATVRTKFLGDAWLDVGNKLSYVLSLNFVFEKFTQAIMQAVQATKEMDKDMTQIGLVLGKTSQQVWRSFDTYAKSAERLNTTVADLTSGMKLFYQQGLNTTEVNKMVEASAIAAALGETTLAEAAETLTSVVNSYNLTAHEAMEVTDKISQIAIVSAADFGEISVAIEKVASSAASAGLDLDHMVGYLAKMIETSREAPTNIGTALKTIVANFTQFREDPSGLSDSGSAINKVDTALRSVGISLTDTNGEVRDLSAVLDELGSKWDSLNRNQKSYLATSIAGTRQQSRFYALMNDYQRTLELVEEGSNSAGKSYQQFALYSDSLEASTKRLENQMQIFFNNLSKGGGILSSFNDILATFMKLVNFMGAIPATAGLVAFISSMRGIANDSSRLIKVWQQFSNINKTFNDKNVALIRETLQKVDSKKITAKEGKSEYKQQRKNLFNTRNELLNKEGGAMEEFNKLDAKSQQLIKNLREIDRQTALSIQNTIKQGKSFENLRIKWIQFQGTAKSTLATMTYGIKAVGTALISVAKAAVVMFAIQLAFQGLAAIADKVSTALGINTAQFVENAEKAQNQADSIRSLSDEYTVLSSKLNKSRDEQKRLNEIIEEATKIDSKLGAQLKANANDYDTVINLMEDYIDKQEQIQLLETSKAYRSEGNFFNSWLKGFSDIPGLFAGDPDEELNLTQMGARTRGYADTQGKLNNLNDTQQQMLDRYVEIMIGRAEAKVREGYGLSGLESASHSGTMMSSIDDYIARLQGMNDATFKRYEEYMAGYTSTDTSLSTLQQIYTRSPLNVQQLVGEDLRSISQTLEREIDNMKISDLDKAVAKTFAKDLSVSELDNLFNSRTDLSGLELENYNESLKNFLIDPQVIYDYNLAHEKGSAGLIQFKKDMIESGKYSVEFIETLTTADRIISSSAFEQAIENIAKIGDLARADLAKGEVSQLDILKELQNGTISVNQLVFSGKGIITLDQSTLISEMESQWKVIEEGILQLVNNMYSDAETFNPANNKAIQQYSSVLRDLELGLDYRSVLNDMYDPNTNLGMSLVNAANIMDVAKNMNGWMHNANLKEVEKQYRIDNAGKTTDQMIQKTVQERQDRIQELRDGIDTTNTSLQNLVTQYASTTDKEIQEKLLDQMDEAAIRIDLMKKDLEGLLDNDEVAVEVKVLTTQEINDTITQVTADQAAAANELKKAYDEILDQVKDYEKKMKQVLYILKQNVTYSKESASFFKQLNLQQSIFGEVDSLQAAYQNSKKGKKGWQEMLDIVSADPKMAQYLETENNALKWNTDLLKENARKHIESSNASIDAEIARLETVLASVDNQVVGYDNWNDQVLVDVAGVIGGSDLLNDTEADNISAELKNLGLSEAGWISWSDSVCKAIKAAGEQYTVFTKNLLTGGLAADRYASGYIQAPQVTAQNVNYSKQLTGQEARDYIDQTFKDLNQDENYQVTKEDIKANIEEQIKKLKGLKGYNNYVLKNLDAYLSGTLFDDDSGSEFEQVIHALDKFYNYLKQIQRIENKIANLQAKQAQIDLTNNYHISYLEEENELLKQKYEILTKMIPEQQTYLAALRQQLTADYGEWISFDQAGTPILSQTKFVSNSEAEEERYEKFTELREEYEKEWQDNQERITARIEVQNTLTENLTRKYEKLNKEMEDIKTTMTEIVELEQHRKDISFREVFALRYYESILDKLQTSYNLQNNSYKTAVNRVRELDNRLRDLNISKWVQFNDLTQQWQYSTQYTIDLLNEDTELMAQVANIQSLLSEYEKASEFLHTAKDNMQEIEATIKSMVDGAISDYSSALESIVEQNTEILDTYQQSLDIMQRENDLYEGTTKNLQEYYDLTLEGAAAAKYAMESYQETAEKAIETIKDKYGEYVTEINGQYAINEVTAKEQLTSNEIADLEHLLTLYKAMNDAANDSQDQFLGYMETIKELEETKRDAIIDVMQQIRDELEAIDQKELDDLQEKYDEMNRLDNEYYSSLSQKIEDARQKRDRQQSTQAVSQLRNQIAVLERDSSGAFSTELRDLRQQLTDSLQEQADQNIDDELERIDREQQERQKDREIQITQMENLIDFKVENGMYWDQAYDLWESGRASVESFLAAMYERQDLSKEEIAKSIQETNATLDSAWVKYGEINAQKVGETISPIAENLRNIQLEVLPAVEQAIITNGNNIETAQTAIVTALEKIQDAISEIYIQEDNAKTIEQMMENGKLWADASPEEKKQLNNTNKALGSKVGLTYDAPTGLYYDKYGQAAYNGTDKTQYNPKYDIVGMARASEQMQANGDQWRENMTPSEKNALHEKNVKLAAPYGWYYDPATGIWYTDPTKKQRVYDVYEDGGYVDYTGFAKVDGTPSKPEAFLNAQQTQLFEQLRDSLAGKKLRTTTNDSGNEGDNIIINNLEISVKEIADADSIDKVVKTVKQSIYKDATATSGITKVSRR